MIRPTKCSECRYFVRHETKSQYRGGYCHGLPPVVNHTCDPQEVRPWVEGDAVACSLGERQTHAS